MNILANILEAIITFVLDKIDAIVEVIKALLDKKS